MTGLALIQELCYFCFVLYGSYKENQPFYSLWLGMWLIEVVIETDEASFVFYFV